MSKGCDSCSKDKICAIAAIEKAAGASAQAVLNKFSRGLITWVELGKALCLIHKSEVAQLKALNVGEAKS